MAKTYYSLYAQRYAVEPPQTEDDLMRLASVAWNSPSRKIRQAIVELFHSLRQDAIFVVVGQRVLEIDEQGKPLGWCPYDNYVRNYRQPGSSCEQEIGKMEKRPAMTKLEADKT